MIPQPQIVTLSQNTPEWLAFRRKYRTASETPVVMGLSPRKTAARLAAEKFRGIKPANGNMATKHGHDNEAIARQALEQKLGKAFPAKVMVNGVYLASLDGLHEEGKEICEIKCPFSGCDGRTWKEAEWGNIEAHYHAQVQHQLMVTGADVAHFWVWDSRSRAGLMIDVAPDPEWFNEIHRWWEWFESTYNKKVNAIA